MVATVATVGRAQRRYGAPNETGTLTTSQPPAWTTSVSYVRDPTAGGTNLVTNVGNLYQCRTDHTSSGANEPTTTSDTTQWKYLGAAPAVNDTVSGSQIIAIHAGRTPLATPSDNDSGSFTSISEHGYADYADWGIGVWRRSSSSNTKSGYTVSVTWAGTSPGAGAGEEVTLFWLELRNVIVGAPHTDVHVERASPTGGTVTGANYTLTTRCLVVSVWGGSGAVVTAGTSHTAVPLGGISALPLLDTTLSISEDGYIQVRAGWAIRDPGTYADQWTSNEGAQLFTIAWPVSELDGAASVTLGTAASNAIGKVEVQGAGSATLGAATLSAVGAGSLFGAADVTLGTATAAAAGTVLVQGSASPALADATASSAGVVFVQGTGSAALGAAATSAAGTVLVNGAANAALDAATVVATGGVGSVGVGGGTLAESAVNATGAVAVQGVASPTLDAATATGAGAVAVQGAASPTLEAVASLGAGAVLVQGSGSPSLAAASLSADGTVTGGTGSREGTAAITLGSATLSSVGGRGATGTLNARVTVATRRAGVRVG